MMTYLFAVCLCGYYSSVNMNISNLDFVQFAFHLYFINLFSDDYGEIGLHL